MGAAKAALFNRLLSTARPNRRERPRPRNRLPRRHRWRPSFIPLLATVPVPAQALMPVPALVQVQARPPQRAAQRPQGQKSSTGGFGFAGSHAQFGTGQRHCQEGNGSADYTCRQRQWQRSARCDASFLSPDGCRFRRPLLCQQRSAPKDGKPNAGRPQKEQRSKQSRLAADGINHARGRAKKTPGHESRLHAPPRRRFSFRRRSYLHRK